MYIGLHSECHRTILSSPFSGVFFWGGGWWGVRGFWSFRGFLVGFFLAFFELKFKDDSTVALLRRSEMRGCL